MREKREKRKTITKSLKRAFVFNFTLSLFSLLFSLFSLPSLAGGPWFVDADNSGDPARWPWDAARSKWVVKWKIDPGPLAEGPWPISSSEAKSNYVDPMLADWKNVSIAIENSEGVVETIQTVAIDFDFLGNAQEADIDVSNYCDYAIEGPGCLDQARPPNSATVIFDIDGSIIYDYCLQQGSLEAECNEARNAIAGQAKPFVGSNFKLIRHGFIFLNGRLVDGNPQNGEADPEGFKAIIKHEFGHLLNLDHSQVNASIAVGCAQGSCETGQGVGTMFPQLVTPEQMSLHRDERVSISWLYPAQPFQEKFCIIVGEVENKDGKGIQGVNVIARDLNDPLLDARSMVSGVLYMEGSEEGGYILSGLTPGKDYEVIFEELLAEYNADEASSFGPLGSGSPTGFGSGNIAGPNGEISVRCNAGGEVITMSTLKLDIEQGRAISGALNVAGGEGGEGKKKGWFCQLSVDQKVPGNAWHFLTISSLGLILLGLRLKLRRGSSL